MSRAAPDRAAQNEMRRLIEAASILAAVDRPRGRQAKPPPRPPVRGRQSARSVSFFSGGMSPISMLFWCVHSVRSRTKPELTDSTQFFVSEAIANSTASRGFCVASTMAGMTFARIAIDGAVRLDHRGDDIAQQVVVLGDQRIGGAVGVEAVFWPQVGHGDQHMGAGLSRQHDVKVFRVQRDGIDLAGDEAGHTAGGALRNELRIVGASPAGAAPRDRSAS